MTGKLIPALLLVLLSFAANGQSAKQRQYAGIGIKAGLTSNMVMESYERFRTNYNTANLANLSTHLGELAPQNGAFVGVEAYASILHISYRRYFIPAATATAVFRNGTRRELRLTMPSQEFNFDILFPVSKKVEFGATFGGLDQRGTIYSGYRYKNGYLSYAEDQPLNGIYRMRMDFVGNLGLRADIHLKKKFRLSLAAEAINGLRFLTENKAIDMNALVPHQDEFVNNVAGGFVYSDGRGRLYMAEDPADGNNSTVSFVGQGNTLRGPYQGWRLSAEVRYDFIRKRLKMNGDK